VKERLSAALGASGEAEPKKIKPSAKDEKLDRQILTVLVSFQRVQNFFAKNHLDMVMKQDGVGSESRYGDMGVDRLFAPWRHQNQTTDYPLMGSSPWADGNLSVFSAIRKMLEKKRQLEYDEKEVKKNLDRS
jgi:hypothetical protein